MRHLADQFWDVIIIGAGPVGLSLAKGLASHNKSVLVLEKKVRLSEHSKAATVWPGTQEVLQRLGVLASIEQASLIKECLQLWDADVNPERPLFTLPLSELKDQTPYARLLILPQDQTERILYESLGGEPTVKVLFGAEATKLIDEGSVGVEITYERQGAPSKVRGRFVVGCDGPKSFVRESLGYKLEGETYTFQAGLADVRFEVNQTLPSPRISTKHRPYVGIQISQDLWRIILLDEEPKTDREFDLDIKQAVNDLFGPRPFESVWKSQFRLHRRTSEAFSKGYVILAGDAAHLNSPVGGQGMNAGIQDTEVLCEALLRSLKAGSIEDITAYAKKRKRAIEEGVNKNTGRMTNLIFAGHGQFIRYFFASLKWALKIPTVRRRFLKATAMI